MAAVRLWAGVLLRRHWRATILLGLLCGVAAGAVGAGWATARTTARAFPRFVAQAAGGGHGYVSSCAHGNVDFDCGREYPPRAVRDTVARVPGVRSAARSMPVVGRIHHAGGDDLTLFIVYAESPGSSENGSGLLLAGDRDAPRAPGDIIINEAAARQFHLTAGQHVTFTPYLQSQTDAANGGAVPHGPPINGRVVGVVRQPVDLATDAANSTTANFAALEMLAPPEWWAAEPDVYRYGNGVAIAFDTGADPGRVKAAVVRSLRPRSAQFEPETTEAVATVSDAIDYEVWATRAFAIVTALVGLLLLGQALSRQVAAEESNDAGLLRALGLTRGQLALSSGLRWTATGVIAAVSAVAVMVAVSPVAPIGVARKTVAHASVDLDVPVALLIAIATVGAIALGTTWSAWRVLGRKANSLPSSTLAVHVVGPTATTGVAATLRSLRRPFSSNAATAVGAIVLVAVAAIASATMVQSYDRLLTRPPQYGAPWDAVVGNSSGPEEAAQVAAKLSHVNGIDGAAGLIDLDQQFVGKEDIPFVVFVAAGDLPQTVGPEITAGRAPTGPEEIALGAITMRHLGVGIGDTIRMRLPNTRIGHLRTRIVGRALLNDTYGLEPGVGGVVYGPWAQKLLRGEGLEIGAQQIAVRIADGANRAEVLSALRRAFPDSFSKPIPSTGLRNLGRIRRLPWTLVGMLALLGTGVALQALLASIRRRRHELAVLRAIGFTAGDARASLRWQVAALSLIAAALTIPLGVLAGRLGWQLITRANGLAMGPVIPRGIVLAVAALAFAVPVALIAIPAWFEVRRNTAGVLRTE